MSKWNFLAPSEQEPGEHAYALVVYDNKEVGVRCLERAYIRQVWGTHVFAWQPMVYPDFNIDDIGIVVDKYRSIPKAANHESA